MVIRSVRKDKKRKANIYSISAVRFNLLPQDFNDFFNYLITFRRIELTCEIRELRKSFMIWN